MPIIIPGQDVYLVSRGLHINITSFVPQKGDTFADEMRCYSLPYGGLGFASHVLTYYAITCLWAGRRPLWPFRKIKYSKWDLSLGVIALILSVGLSIFTILMCKNRWQLLVIAVWKLSMSLLNGITAVHAAAVVLSSGGVEPKTGKAAWWILLYVPGMFAGMTGLMSIVIQNWDKPGVRKLTISFYCIVGAGAVVFLVGLCRGMIRRYRRKPAQGKEEKETDEEKVWYWGIGGFAFSTTLFIVLAAFYGDWALGIMANNLVGLPSGDASGLYWSYFISKRLTMFSW